VINITGIQATPKTLIWDVETSYMLLRGYDLYPKGGFSPTAIERDWFMLGAAWKWLGETETKAVSVNPRSPQNDYQVIEVLHSVLSEAEILIGHNSDNFDYKKFNTRAIKHGFHPISPKKTIDTLKLARKHFKFSSNQLRYIADFLEVAEKDESPDWAACIAGDEEALRHMRKYNRQDVITTEQVYLKLRGFHNTHPNMNVINPVKDVAGESVHVCPKCLSPHLQSRGYAYSRGKLKTRYQCMECGGWHQL